MRGACRVAACIVLLLAGACGSVAAPSGPRYQVVAVMLSVEGKPPTACHMILTSLPPAGCSGVPVVNTELRTIPGRTVYGNGTIETPSLRLIGAWNGHELALTQRPAVVSTDAETTPLPARTPESLGMTSRSPTATSEEIARDSATLRDEGIVILETGMGADGLEVLLAVADTASVRTIYERYGAVHISGWMQPA